ncbi:Sec-independent protein translocase subunit TatA/TatB [Micromonospora sp. LZ34]
MTGPTADGGGYSVRVERPAPSPVQTGVLLALPLLLIAAGEAALSSAFGEFGAAWTVWWDGRSASQQPLWGHTVLWWARVGKLLQFAAGLVVVLDLLGPERLRAAGRRLSHSYAEARQLATAMRPEIRRTLPTAVQSAVAQFLLVANIGLAIMFAVQWTTVRQNPTLLAPLAVSVVAFGVILLVGGPAVQYGVRMPFIGLFLLLTTLVLAPIAAVLDNANPGHLLRWLGVGFFVAGFTLDLLGS